MHMVDQTRLSAHELYVWTPFQAKVKGKFIQILSDAVSVQKW